MLLHCLTIWEEWVLEHLSFPNGDVCSILVLTLLIGSPIEWVLAWRSQISQQSRLGQTTHTCVWLIDMRRHSPHELGTIRIPLNSPIRRVWMASFNFFVSKKHAKVSELYVPNHRGSPAQRHSRWNVGIWLAAHYFLFPVLPWPTPPFMRFVFSEFIHHLGQMLGVVLFWHDVVSTCV